MRPGMHPSEGLAGPAGLAPKAVHSHGWLVGAAERQVRPFLSTGQNERPHIMAAGFPQRKRSESKKKLQDFKTDLIFSVSYGSPRANPEAVREGISRGQEWPWDRRRSATSVYLLAPEGSYIPHMKIHSPLSKAPKSHYIAASP